MSNIPRDAFERLTAYVVDGWNAYHTDGEIADGADIREDVRAVLTELRQLRGLYDAEGDPDQFLLGRPISADQRLLEYAANTARWDYIHGRMWGAPSLAEDAREVVDTLKKLRERVGPAVFDSMQLQDSIKVWLDKLTQENAQMYEHYRGDIDGIVKLANDIAYKLHPDKVWPCPRD